MPRGYSREQRAAKAALLAGKAAESIEARQPAASSEPSAEPRQEAPQGTIQLRNEPRTRAFEEIEARHAERSGITEPSDEEEAAPDAPKEPEVAQAAETVTPAVGDSPPLGSPAAAPAPAVEMVTVKVDGESFDVPKTEVEEAGGVRAFQTMRAADNRLKKANETLAETKRAQEQAAAFARTLAEAQKPVAPEPTDDELLNAIRFGQGPEAMAALRKLRGEPVNQTAIVMQAAAINNYNTARRKFGVEFQDLTTNPVLVKTALALEQDYIQSFAQNGQVNWSNLANIDFEDGFRRIGNQVRSAFGSRPSQSPSAPAVAGTAVTTASPPSPPSAKEERKASIVNLPTAASARAEPPAEDKPETHAEIINGMRKARGLHPI